MSALPALAVVSPLPPQRNGIADYAAMLLPALARHYDCTAVVAQTEAQVPPGMALRQIAEAAPWPARVLHQLGNNPFHSFVLPAMRQAPGVVTLHDPVLGFLHAAGGTAPAAVLAAMLRQAPRHALPLVRQAAARGGLALGDEQLFDRLAGPLAAARAVVVHSRHALGRLRALHGRAATRHVRVIPHLSPPLALPGREAARAALGIPPDGFLVVTAGFETAAKRLDWVAAALDQALGQGARLLYRHAGEASLLPLHLAARPALAAVSAITGYADAATLDAHIAAADLLLNLRYPNAGESSGTLARGLAAGTCCIVSDTGAFAELPRQAVLHIPVLGAVPALAAAVGALAAQPSLARSIGAAGQRHALAEAGLDVIATRYRDVIEESRHWPPPGLIPAPEALALPLSGLRPAALAALLAERHGPCRLNLWAEDAAALAQASLDQPALLAELLPPTAQLRSLRVQWRPRPALTLDLLLPEPA